MRQKLRANVHQPVPKVFIGITETAGYYRNLAQGLRQLGLDVTVVGSDPYGYGGESRNLAILPFSYAVRKWRLAPPSARLRRLFWFLWAAIGATLLALWAIPCHDIFIFGFGRSFTLDGRDLWLLRKLNKRIICNVGHGSEARPPYVDGAYQSDTGLVYTPAQNLARTRAITCTLRRIERYADHVICTPFTGHFLRRPFIVGNLLGIPCPASTVTVGQAGECQDGKVRVLHAPSHPHAKGTPRIRQAIAHLQQRGYAIDFVEIVGRPNREVLEELACCDFVIDQVYSDTPLAGFATEAAAFGKPAVVGGYGWTQLKALIPAESFPVSQICHPNDLEAAIERLIVDETYRIALGQQAQYFVHTQWTVKAVAQRYLRLIMGEAPDDWLFDPYDIRYVHGACLSETEAQAQVRDLVATFGKAALMLTDKPALERLFLEFAGVEDVGNHGA